MPGVYLLLDDDTYEAARVTAFKNKKSLSKTVREVVVEHFNPNTEQESQATEEKAQ